MNTLTKIALPLAALSLAAPAVAAQTAQAAGAEQTITAYTTGYTWFDNTPVGSAAIAHPVLHKKAGGTGSYADPITLATASGKFPVGTRFYIPNMRRYFIAEDIGGANMYNPPAGASAWLDMWIGGAGGSASGADRCAMSNTGNHAVIVNPKNTYAVATGRIYDGTCHGGFGEALVKAPATATVKTPAATKKATPVKKVATTKPRSVAATPSKAATKPVTKAVVKPVVKPVAKPAVEQSYVVRAGDTLTRIATGHATTWQRVFQLNRATLSSPNVLFIGQKLLLG